MKSFTNLIIVLIVFIAGFLLGKSLDSLWESKTMQQQESVILLEKIKTVSKLVTVEGYFSEVYKSREWEKRFGFNLNFALFVQDARLRVNAKALVGFDLSKMTFQTFPDKKLLVISELPEPEILSVEPEIIYEKLYEGYFNEYTKEERTKLNKRAVDFIKNEVLKNTTLRETAIENGYENLKLIELIAKDAGWEVRYAKDNKFPTIIKDSLKILD
ncbi:MAG: DUF4230 domain-containing protein [Saprospiraceae bacterium]